MEIAIRKVTAKDWPSMSRLSCEYRDFNLKVINKIDRSFRVFEPVFDRKAFIKVLRKQNKYYVAVFDHAKMIGFALACVYDWKMPNNKKIRFGELSEIFLTKGYRGHGIADIVLDECAGWFKNKKVDFLQIRAMIANKHAIDIYKHWGYKPWVLLMLKKI